MSKKKNENEETQHPNENSEQTETENSGQESCTQESSQNQASAQEVPAITIESLQAELAQTKDQYVRKYAEFENFRKRLVKEKTDAISFANQLLLSDIIGIIDNFERALKITQETVDIQSVLDGIKMIQKEFLTLLDKKWGLSKIESIGQSFDPNKHEAVAIEESDSVQSDTVVEDYQSGYMLFSRVLRPSRVKIAKPKANNNGKKSEPNLEIKPEDNQPTSDPSGL